MCNSFRLLEAREIECRVAQAGLGSNGGAWASVLLYKDARVDQRIMDETFGPMNWQAMYELIDDKLYCKVSVWDDSKKCWVSKMNVGTESNTEAEKGQASDALKRACFTWGLGVELYSAPKIMVSLGGDEFTVSEYNGKKTVKVKQSMRLSVSEIAYDDHRGITRLVLVDGKGRERYRLGARQAATQPQPQAPAQKKFTCADGSSSIIKGGVKWKKAVEATRAGAACEDGTPIPIYLADYYNIPDEDMRDFINEVNAE